MEFDVVIAGGGPNGLMLACELALAGVRPLVLERLTGPSGEQRANGMVGQVVRMLDRRGLYERLAGNTTPPRPAPGFMFAAFPLPLWKLPESPVYLMMVPQRRIEEMLAARAAELGVEVRRGHELTGLTQDAAGVTVEVSGPDGTYVIGARFLVGADGGRSLTRKLVGIDFPGVTSDNAVSRSAHVSVPPSLIDKATGGLNVPGYGVIPQFMHHRTERGLVSFAPFPDGKVMLNVTSFAPADTSQPFSIDELRESFAEVVGVDVPIGPPPGDGPHLLRRLTGGNTRLADRYREGRVLLVGDAAHVHSAIGGPGLNLGLQDAINLGWKLAAEVRGWAPPGLLDTYESERRPAGERVTMHTQAQGVLIGPGREVTALRTLFGELLEEQSTLQHIADLIAGADLHYDMGTAATDPLIGRWAPDLVLDNGSGPVRLASLTRSARPLLLDFTGSSLADVAAPWRDRVDVVTGRAQAPATALLIRPDGYVAWASTAAEPDPASLRDALTHWFGVSSLASSPAA